MKKSFIIVFVALFSTTLFARFEVSNVALQWSAFKTPKKVAVKGTFKDMKLSSHSTQSLSSSLM
ncbi:MAG: YceI family protein, partial [Thiovulaceae bacterium]|nr:YceI family protein [Sulfurimonadaceae bacterium]